VRGKDKEGSTENLCSKHTVLKFKSSKKNFQKVSKKLTALGKFIPQESQTAECSKVLRCIV